MQKRASHKKRCFWRADDSPGEGQCTLPSTFKLFYAVFFNTLHPLSNEMPSEP